MINKIHKKTGVFTTSVILTLTSISSFAAIKDDSLLTGSAIKHDTSPPLREMLINIENKSISNDSSQPADYIIPNILNIPPSPTEELFNNNLPEAKEVNGSNGLASPMVDISVDGFTAADNISVVGGIPLPPDTNGDVGIDYYIQYVNLGWKIMNKNDGSVFAGPFIGNSFWDGFGGNCEFNNAGDPIVLYDKNADRWLFSQFTSSGNADGRQCFAISTTDDPLGPYHRYEFVFPGEFNDYPHIGIWDDESGDRSGYYFVTHDFVDVGGPNQGFNQASYAVVERDSMLVGDPAQFVRFTDTTFLGASSFGAQPAHLESKQLAPSGMCNPFVLGRPDQPGYQLVDLCVDWQNAANSTLSAPFIVDAGESWNPGPGGISQPGTSQTLGTLAGFGRILYRASFRAYPPEKELDDTMVISFPVNVGGGQAGVRWAQINFPTGSNPEVANQGEYAPDTTDRWMSGISIDQDGNIGLAYSAANSAQGVFPGVRFTTRNHTDAPNTLRDEEICVDGGGIQTSTSGRWGDYSSMSVDPVDECTFWASVEYQLNTAERNWSNRVCSFKIENCGESSFALNAGENQSISICSANEDTATFDFGIIDSNGFSETVDVELTGQPVGSTVTFPDGASFDTFPATSSFELSNLTNEPTAEYAMTLTGTSLSANATSTYQLSISSSATTVGTTLIAPLDNASGVDDLIFANGFELPIQLEGSYPTFEWEALIDAQEYRLEVSTDENFSNIIIDVVTDELSYTSESPLENNTSYYWRVTAINNCGPGVPSVTYEFTTGDFLTGTVAECTGGTTPNVVFFDDIEGDLSGWDTPVAPVGSNTWATSSAQSFAGTAWFGQDVAVSSDQYLVSPSIDLPAIDQSPISLSYWNFQEMETDSGSGSNACWDGGLLEISVNGGAFTQVSNTELIGDPYNGQITSNPASPISGLQAWCASSLVPAAGDQADISIVDLDNYAGQTVQFRFRLGTDNAVGAEGWYLDNLTVQGCQ